MKTKKFNILQAGVLSLSLLVAGTANAQTTETGNTSLEIRAADALAVTAGDINFGIYTASATAINASLVCGATDTSGPDADVVTAGTCGDVTITRTGAAGNVTVTATATDLTSTAQGATAITAPSLVIYDSANAEVTAAQAIAQDGNISLQVGGTFTIGANQTAGNYTGTYTFTATVQ